MYRVIMRVRHGDVNAMIARVGETIADALAAVLGSGEYGVGYGPTTAAGQEMIRATLEHEDFAAHGWADYEAERVACRDCYDFAEVYVGGVALCATCADETAARLANHSD